MDKELNLKLSIRIFKEEKLFGPGIADLLRNIDRTGSLQKATKAMGMAYSKGWKMIKSLESLWGFPFTYRDVGGENGGGSSLTPEGRFLLESYERFSAEVRENAERLFGVYFSSSFYNDLKH